MKGNGDNVNPYISLFLFPSNIGRFGREINFLMNNFPYFKFNPN